jgi:hypothetical protein
MGTKVKPSSGIPSEELVANAKSDGWDKKGRLWVKPDPTHKRSRKNANARSTNY